MRDRIPAAACHSGIYLQLVPIGHVENVSRLRAAERDRRFHRRTINSYAGDDAGVSRTGSCRIVRGAQTHAVRAHGNSSDGKHYFDIHRSRRPVAQLTRSTTRSVRNGSRRMPQSCRTVEIHVFPIQYNALEKQWLNYWKVIDSARAAERADLHSWEKLELDDELPGCLRRVPHQPIAQREGRRLRHPIIWSFARPVNRLRNVPRAICPARGASMNSGDEYQQDAARSAGRVRKDRQSRFCGNLLAVPHAVRDSHARNRTGELNYSTTGTFLYARPDDSLWRIFTQGLLQGRPFSPDHIHRRGPGAFEMLSKGCSQLRYVPQSAYARRSRRIQPP